MPDYGEIVIDPSRDNLLTEFGKTGRAGTVGCFLPALSTAYHAREQTQGLAVLHPVAKAFFEHGREFTRDHGEDAARKVALFQSPALGVKTGATQGGSAPVDGDQRTLKRRVHVDSRACTAAGVGKGATAPWPCTDRAAAALA